MGLIARWVRARRGRPDRPAGPVDDAEVRAELRPWSAPPGPFVVTAGQFAAADPAFGPLVVVVGCFGAADEAGFRVAGTGGAG